MVLRQKHTPQTDFTSFITLDCVNRYPYLIPNGIMPLEKIDFLYRVNFRLEKRPNLHSSGMNCFIRL
jgi:hypothetical protein